VAPLREKLREVAVRTPLAPNQRFRRAARPAARTDLASIGSDYGGWTIPEGLVEPGWVCYSGGVGDDITFDLGFIERFGCTVHAFDPTPSAIEHARKAGAGEEWFVFHPWGLWSEDTTIRFYAPDYGDSNFSAANIHGTEDFFEAPCRSLTSIMGELGHDRIDLLKLDIEGAEYDVLRSVLERDVEPAVLCVEYHKTDGIRAMVESVRELRERGYRAVHVDGYDVTFVAAGA
jgi:FkbM family methyltransferase